MVFVASQVTPSTEVHVNGLPIAPLTDITTTDAFIHIAMDSSVPSSLLTAHNDGGFFSAITLTNDMLPDGSPVQLTVGSLGAIMFSRLDNFYSPDRNLILSFSVPTESEATDLYAGFTAADGISIALQVDMRVDVAQSGTTDVPEEEIALIGLGITGTGEILVSNTASDDGIIIAGSVGTLSVADPTVEYLKDGVKKSLTFFDVLPTTLDTLLKTVVIPAINDFLSAGIEFMLPGGMSADGVSVYYMDEMCYITCSIEV
ncbi:hypothetical protein ADUPG1_013511 [Aduncisulcus paluster]|uniref:Uncharacterized protein n=1 Tax=Aduncisulcus paluster TaxID=2918883 RepID=A0ABQ5K6U2_9EUKA|nr:hypothetical protein ADUPG1_013511 [Aduncisulcus paluster]